jgi:hypothetical protein
MEINFNKKNKFIENKNNEINKQPYYNYDNLINLNDITKENYNSKTKTNIELNKTLDPFNYNLNYVNKIRKDVKGEEEFVYFAPYNQEAGRGFGNLNIGNNIRMSESSRLFTDEFKIYKESEINDRFDYLDNRYSNPDNLVFPFPRSGETTRLINNINNISEYNFNKPTVTQNDNFSPIFIENKSILPNKKIIEDIKEQTEIQKKNQLNYKIKLEKTQLIIDNLKKIYGNSLTKDIIFNELRKENIIDQV